jgi:hypothetical protein
VQDQNENPVANATVSGIWSTGAAKNGACTTNATGQCSIVQSGLLRKKEPTVTFTIADVAGASLSYDPSANHDPGGDSNGTSITVVAP